MAGKEVSGVENADPKIFVGANYIVTPTKRNTDENVQAVKDLGRALGFERISSLSPEEHDETVGFLSHLTHCIAVSLMVSKSRTILPNTRAIPSATLPASQKSTTICGANFSLQTRTNS